MTTEQKIINLVTGRITDKQNRPIPDLLVEIYDRSLRSEQKLGSAITDRNGEYEVPWNLDQLKEKGKKSADLIVKVLSRAYETLLYQSGIDQVRYKAIKREEVHIKIDRDREPDMIEFDYLHRSISQLAENVPFHELQENENHRDLSFLSNKIQVPREKTEHFIVAHRLAAASGADAAFFYALLRKKTLLKTDLASFYARLAIDINSDTDTLLYDVAMADPKLVTRDVEHAAKTSIVSTQAAKEVRKNLDILKAYKAKGEAYYSKEHPKAIVQLVSRFILEDKLGAMAAIYKESKNDMEGFLQKITNDDFFRTKDESEQAKAMVKLGEIFGFEEQLLSEVMRSLQINTPGDVSKLAAYNKSEWKELLNKTGEKLQVNGNHIDKNLVSLHASSLSRKMERHFPQVAFKAQLEREKKPVVEHFEEIREFLLKNEDFDLARGSVEDIKKEKEKEGESVTEGSNSGIGGRGTKKEKESIYEELKSIQRIYKLAPKYSATMGLLEQGVHSAQAIASAGESRFLKEIAPKAGIRKKEAREIFRRAERTNTAAMLIVGELQDLMTGMEVSAMRMESLPIKLEAVVKDFPNLKSLFKLTDTCACDHCRSVYSPAAYMVELLEFLDKRSVTDITVVPALTSKKAKDVLFSRRPDLGDIDLGCENSNTPLPYIDLVCELLEEVVSPDAGIAYNGVLSDGPDPLNGKVSNALFTALEAAGLPVTKDATIYHTEVTSGSSATLPHYLRDRKLVCKIIHNAPNDYTVKRLRQTLSPAEELAAAPEYVNANAYTELAAKYFAFQLPFDLNHTESAAYFNRFGIERAQLMRDFQSAGVPKLSDMAAEALKITSKEKDLIIKPDVAGQQAFWNTTSATASDEMKVVSHFMEKSGLSYKDLDLFLQLPFIDPADNLFIKHLDLSCDTDKKEIAGLTDTALDRMHRFLRLQKKTGWPLTLVEEIISQDKLGKGKLNDADDDADGILNGEDLLIHAADLKRLSSASGIPVTELIGFYGTIPFNDYAGDRGVKPLYQQVFLNKAKNGFLDEGLLPEKVDGSQLLSNFKTSLSVSLQVSSKDLDLLLPILPDGNLNFANLSQLFAASRLIKKLKIKAEDFVLLRTLSGIDFQSSPAKTLEFVELIRKLKSLSFKLADLRFFLRHEASNLADREIKDEKIKTILQKLQADYQKAFTNNKTLFKADLEADEQKESLLNLLLKIPGMMDADAKKLVGFLDRDWTLPADAVNFVTTKMGPPLMDVTNITNSINALDAAPGPDIEAERMDLLKAYFEVLSIYYTKEEKKRILEAMVLSSFKSEPELAKIVLEEARLRQPLPGTEKLKDLLMADALIDKVNEVPVLPAITPAAFGDQYRALRLVHKLLPFAGAFKLELPFVQWLFKNSAVIGWMELDTIPYQAGQNPISFSQYLAFEEFAGLAKKLKPVINPSDAEKPVHFLSLATMLLPVSATTRSQWIEAFSLLSGMEKTDVDELDAYLFPVFNLNPYRDPKTWDKMIRLQGHLRKMGMSVAQVKEVIKPILTATHTGLLRTTLKSKYDEETWLSTLKEIMDAIRPQKRNALLSYILATQSQMRDANDLFDYLLVDVEMEACMPSSRIVQAHGSIQLFVQRCLMGLEPKAAADKNNDRNWEQWKWMKNYRVWEANRKVFLYPENWIEPELRDDKSYLFKELENELLQNELNAFTAEEALIRYLEKLDNIAFLEVVATWYQQDNYTMHVFARSKGGDPAIYYYRRFEKERYWTPWEKVELDITSDHLLAFMRNNRLCLAWPVFSDEPDPEPESTIPNSTAGSVVKNDKPKRKLCIQLAISELANKKWQPKKISAQAIKTPPDQYTVNKIPRESFKFFYNQFADQILVFNTEYKWVNTGEFSGDYYPTTVLAGAFDIAGCKGYPELAPAKPFNLNFIPKFRDTDLLVQRYREMNLDASNDLSVLNLHAYFKGLPVDEILKITPGNFRVTYPHQFTNIDLLAFLVQYLLLFINGNDRNYKSLVLPMGTLLPYFKEDSKHAYVIVPGFYRKEKQEDGTGPLLVQRTAGNVLQLIDDVVAFLKNLNDYNTTPTPEKLAGLMDDFHAILKEIQLYPQLKYGEQFKNMYHPLVCSLRTTLYKHGIPELMKRETQLQQSNFNFASYYDPNPSLIPKTYVLQHNGVKTLSWPVEDIDFSTDGSYSGYNWELFFHVPFLLATRLTKNQKFEEALDWFHYIFNPTGALEGDAPQKYWVTKPFYQTHSQDYINQRIDTLLYKIADPGSAEKAELEFAIDEWRNKPFKPHVVARFRPVAYQKALLMKYIDNLTEWGDHLFRQDTMESIAQATQMYILADKLLGPKPKTVPPLVKPPYETYNQLEAKIDAFGNALIELENILPDLSALPEGGAELPPPPVTLSMLYFCIPRNDKMLEYWDRIADRLFKIRHCQNIDGVERSLALFALPIDPGMLVRAAASGLDLSSIISGMNAPAPYYRFQLLSQKATELVQEVRGLGNSLLMALEKKDSESMSLLQGELQMALLKQMTAMKKQQVEEALEQIDILKKTKAVTEEKSRYYTTIQKIIANEQLNLDKLDQAVGWQTAANITYALGAGLALIPDFALGASGFGGSPHGAAKFGGSLLAHSTDAIGKGLGIFSTIASYEANRASILGGYDRRYSDWKLQDRLAKKELVQIDRQIVAAEIRKELAEKDLKNHELQIENAEKTDDFMRSKFTNRELYEWTIGQISSVYFRAYQLSHDVAKKAERSYQHELGTTDSFIDYGYWDSMKKGLQSAERLMHDLKRMESSYLDRNKREYEITRHVSLSMLDPLALIRLRSTGVCDFEIPEALYDMDHPGQYFRRIKSVSLSMPCIAGPFTSVSGKLSLVSNRYRKNTNADNNAGTGYLEDLANDERFAYNIGSIQSIATSNGQNDSGMFELNFRDERFLPFEGCGAISNWRFELPATRDKNTGEWKGLRQFDYDTIADVIIHIKYTAREGGSSVKGLAEDNLKQMLDEMKQQLNKTGLHVALNVKYDMPNEWHLLKKNATVELNVDTKRLPYFVQSLEPEIENVTLLSKVNENPSSYELDVDGTTLNLARIDSWGLVQANTTDIDLETPFVISGTQVNVDELEELVVLVKYSFG